MNLAIAPEAESETLEEFVARHSEKTNDGTCTWTYRFDAPDGHDVLCLVISGPDSAALLTAAATAAGLVANVHETYH